MKTHKCFVRPLHLKYKMVYLLRKFLNLWYSAATELLIVYA